MSKKDLHAKIRAKIAEKKMNRSGQGGRDITLPDNKKSNFSTNFKMEDAHHMGFRQQKEFGEKKRIKP